MIIAVMACSFVAAAAEEVSQGTQMLIRNHGYIDVPESSILYKEEELTDFLNGIELSAMRADNGDYNISVYFGLGDDRVAFYKDGQSKCMVFNDLQQACPTVDDVASVCNDIADGYNITIDTSLPAVLSYVAFESDFIRPEKVLYNSLTNLVRDIESYGKLIEDNEKFEYRGVPITASVYSVASDVLIGMISRSTLLRQDVVGDAVFNYISSYQTFTVEIAYDKLGVLSYVSLYSFVEGEDPENDPVHDPYKEVEFDFYAQQYEDGVTEYEYKINARGFDEVVYFTLLSFDEHDGMIDNLYYVSDSCFGKDKNVITVRSEQQEDGGDEEHTSWVTSVEHSHNDDMSVYEISRDEYRSAEDKDYATINIFITKDDCPYLVIYMAEELLNCT